MKPHEVDPSLLAAEPPRERLDDGFSPPPEDAAAKAPSEHEAPVLVLSSQSPL